jgi:cytochrome b
MNASSTSPTGANAPVKGTNPIARRVLVWDAPLRVFHWMMAATFAGAYLTAEDESWRTVHVTLGYTMASLVVFRIVWGVIGPRWARFSSFVRGPAAVARYLRSILQGTPEHYTGHNPAGALAIVALLGLTLIITATGWLTYKNTMGEWLEESHEVVANLMLAVVGVHLAGVLLGTWLHRENLAKAMITGYKSADPADGVRSSRRGVAALMVVAVLAFWGLQWQGSGSSQGGSSVTSHGDKDHDGDD